MTPLVDLQVFFLNDRKTSSVFQVTTLHLLSFYPSPIEHTIAEYFTQNAQNISLLNYWLCHYDLQLVHLPCHHRWTPRPHMSSQAANIVVWICRSNASHIAPVRVVK